MNTKKTFLPEELHYLQLLSRQYPTIQAASTQIINLQAILNLPKGTEHFISDIHGEYDYAVDAVKKIIEQKIGNPDMMSFPDDNKVTESEIIYKGSDWGSVEEALRQDKVSDLLKFPAQNSYETSEWRELLEKGTFP